MSIIKKYLEGGLSVLPLWMNHPTHRPKTPRIAKWDHLQIKPMTIAEAAKAFTAEDGIAIITGKVSGGLEVIDVDCKYDLTGQLWEELSEAIKAFDSELFERLVIAKTMSGGYHIGYRCETIQGNRKLANRPATAEELEKYNAEAEAYNQALQGDPDTTKKPRKMLSSPDQLPKALIETRGEKGYIAAWPTAGYEMIQGDWCDAPEISPAQREALFYICEGFNLVKKPERTEVKGTVNPTKPTSDRLSPLTDFNNRHHCIEILQEYGWCVGSGYRGGDIMPMLRDGSDRDKSGVVFQKDNRAFIFSTSTALPSEELLTPVGIYTYMEHSGDFKEAAKALYAKGYGDRIERKPKAETSAEAAPKADKKPKGGQSSDEKKQARVTDPADNPYFKFLGFSKTDEGVQAFHFFAKDAQVLIKLTAAKMSNNNLLMLAPRNFWEVNFPHPTKKFHVDGAVNWLIQTSNQRGYFKEKNIRGRGVWVDAGRVVVHLGNRLIVDGEEKKIWDIDSKFFYEATEEIEVDLRAVMTVEEASKLFTLVSPQHITWERSFSGDLLIGWCVSSVLCGATPWRAHTWITGASDSGKSWLMNHVVNYLLAPIGVYGKGATTESGLRQLLEYDALPVMLEESEGNTKKKQAEIAETLEMMRNSSSDDNARVIKGSQHGKAKRYASRSAFCFASIAPQHEDKRSDNRRITVLGLRRIKDNQQREEYRKRCALYHARNFDTGLPDRFLARVFKMIPIILENFRICKEAVIEHLGASADGDQIGTLLAGMYAMKLDTAVTKARVDADLKTMNFIEEANAQQETDENSALEYLLSQKVFVEQDRSRFERTIGELVRLALELDDDRDVSGTSAHQKLLRIGLDVRWDAELSKGWLYVSSSSHDIKAMFAASEEAMNWGKSHTRILKRIDDERIEDVASWRFGSGLRGRAIKIPLELLQLEGLENM
jgi:putative DNA primase/helicase